MTPSNEDWQRDPEQAAFDSMMDGSERARRGCLGFILVPLVVSVIYWVL